MAFDGETSGLTAALLTGGDMVTPANHLDIDG